jgi:hypothetical protein
MMRSLLIAPHEFNAHAIDAAVQRYATGDS